MAQTETMRCGVIKKNGEPCKQPAGAGVEGVTTGPCKNHGGALPVVRAAQARVALQVEIKNMATAVQMEPMDAMIHVVHMFAGNVLYLNQRAALLAEEDEFVDGALHPILKARRQAGLDLHRVSAEALRAGVAERRVRLAERTGALIGAAFEDALSDVDLETLPAEARASIVRRFVASLQVLEAQESGEQGQLPPG